MLKLTMSNFWKHQLPKGYYDISIEGSKNQQSVQANWHKVTFLKVSDLVNSKDKVLDFACGSGTYLGKYLKNENNIGVDISASQIEYANEKYGGKATFYDLDNFNFEDYKDSFDRVVCLGLLEFIDTIEAKALIKNFISVLKPGGKIIFTTPNFGYSMRIIETVLSKFGSVDYSNEYKFKYTQQSLRLLIDSFRFESVVIKHFMTFAIFTSFINENFARKINNIIEKVTNHKYGLLILMEIEVE